MSILILDKFPAIGIERTLIIETDKKKFRSPAQTVTNMDGRRMTQGKFLVAVRTGMFFLEIGKCSF
jgi:hypothetical protein